MSSKLGIFIILLITTSFASAEDTTTKSKYRPVLPKKEMDEFVFQVNQRRRTFAKQHSIANMHELTWSQKLVDQIAIDDANNNKTDDAEKNYEFVRVGEVLYDADKMIEEIGNDLKNGSEEGYYIKLLFLTPVHREIGCATEVGKHDVCLFAPGTFFKFKYSEKYSWKGLQEILKVKGTPGSQCHQGYGNNDGLCSLFPPTTLAPPTPKPKQSEESSGSPFFSYFHSILVCILIGLNWTIF